MITILYPPLCSGIFAVCLGDLLAKNGALSTESSESHPQSPDPETIAIILQRHRRCEGLVHAQRARRTGNLTSACFAKEKNLRKQANGSMKKQLLKSSTHLCCSLGHRLQVTLDGCKTTTMGEVQHIVLSLKKL